MNFIGLFLLKSVIVSAILTTWYLVGLRNKRLHNYNRFFLLFALYASIQLPLFNFHLFTLHEQPAATVSPAIFLLHQVNDFAINNEHLAMPATHKNINWYVVVLTSILCVSLALMSVLFTRIIWVIRMSRKYPRKQKEGIIFIILHAA